MHNLHNLHNLSIEAVACADILTLRTRVLRPHMQGSQRAHFDGDEDEGTLHIAAWHKDLERSNDQIVGCASFMLRESPWHKGEPAWQLRGMAVAPDFQGQGVGSRLISGACTKLMLRRMDVALIWCNARISARSFYTQCGFLAHGKVFEVEGIGTHVVMSLELVGLIA